MYEDESYYLLLLKFHVPAAVIAYKLALEFVLQSLIVLCNVHEVPKEKIESTWCKIDNTGLPGTARALEIMLQHRI